MNEDKVAIYKAEIKEKNHISLIWLLPFIITIILTWLAYDSYMKKGTTIEIIFKSAEGIKAGITALEYKGIQLGKVTSISIIDTKSVKINILVKKEYSEYVAIKGTSFWIQKPEVSLTKITGLNTLISGYKISLLPGFKADEDFEKTEKQFIFKGLDSKPHNELQDDGYYISLVTNDNELIDIGTPVFYNKFQIGEVVSKTFNYEKVFTNIYIYDKFNYLVNSSSKFIMNEALKVDFGPSGLKIDVESLYSVLVGGITVETPNVSSKKIQKNEVQSLYFNKEDAKEKVYFHINMDTADGIDENTDIIYKGIKVGKLNDIKLGENAVAIRAYVYEKYKYLLSQNSEFFVQKPQLSVSGVKNLGNIVRGNYISLKYKKGKHTIYFNIINSEKLIMNKDDIILTLYSDKLNSISKKSKIFYKNIVIGEVIDYGLSKDYKKVKINIKIDKKYKNLINNHILFYDMSSKLVEIKNLNLNINYSGIEPLLNGGIGLIAEKRKDYLTRKSFKLYNSYKDVEKLKKIYNEGFLITAYFKNDFKIKKNMSIVYENQEIGFVKSIEFNSKKSKVKLFIYDKFKKYINKSSIFYKKGVVDFKASLNGIIFQMDNFTSLLEGSIHLHNSVNKVYNKYYIFSSEETMKNSSNSIKIIFDDVEGLKKEFSYLTYKGVNIGKVTDIKLTDNGKIEVIVWIYKDYTSFSKVGTSYYLKKPEISLQAINNVGSTIMAVNIGVIKSNRKKFKNFFIGYDKRPSIPVSRFGTIFKVIDKSASNVNINSPIYYKNVKIGKVHKVDLSPDASEVVIDCLIYNKYTKFIRKNSSFYDISGFDMDFSLFETTKVKTNTFTSILQGGLEVVTPYDYGARANTKDKFILKKDLEDGWQKISPKIR